MIDEYLARISYAGSREPTRDVLRALHEHHMLSVPFENLDIHWKRPIVVDVDRFLDKILRERRGGFCYELNGAFAALLRALGFDVTMLSGRVISADGTFGPPFDHMALLVRLEDGSRWLADVGFGDSFLAPLSLDERGEQHDRAGTFRIVDRSAGLQACRSAAFQAARDAQAGGTADRQAWKPALQEDEEWSMQVRRGDAWSTEYRFTLDPHELSEYAPMCDYQQFSPQSGFTKKKVCSLATRDGRITLSSDKLIITRSGVREERSVGTEEWEELLRETFGISHPPPLA